ncbi:Bifunctional purine biosynthesis protein PurH [Coemansia javaensis]|uniref:Bifunctional purine biosynthesis protein PurH n=1 Tax=Coemansia javaensis TaxID=2761396 RepID=A0A9W8LG21_9FUNG|nr:Bifunctional purine biosynthesis protein PurH [Coemansia javaensis]
MTLVPSHQLGITRYQLFCALAASLGSVNFGWNFGAMNLPGDVVSKCIAGPRRSIGGLPSCIPANNVIWGLTVGLFALGCLAGALLCTRYADMYGRRAVLMYSGLAAVAGAVLYGAAVNIPMLAAGRLLAGVSAGCANGTLTNYVIEITTPRARNTLASMVQLAVSAGIALATAASLGLTKPPLWRVLFSMTGAIALANSALLVPCVESPKWLAARGRLDEAQAALQRLRGAADCTEEFRALVECVRAEMDPSARAASVVDVLRGRTPDNLRHQLATSVAGMVAQQLSGISGVVFFSTSLFESAVPPPAVYSGRPTVAQMLAVGLAASGVASTLGGMALAGRLGRRTLMLSSHASLAVCSVLIFVGTTWRINGLAIAMVFVFYTAFLAGPGPLPWVIPGEMTPIYAVSSVGAVSGSVGYLLTFAVGMVFPSLLSALHGYTFLILAGLNLLMAALLAFLLPETKDRPVPAMVQIHSVGIHNVMLSKYRLKAPSAAGVEARKEKKEKKAKKTDKADKIEKVEDGRVEKASKKTAETAKAEKKQSEWGVWIGNLAYDVSKDDITRFFAECGGAITRINLPRKGGKARGFAYVDFDTSEAVEAAVGLSEQMLGGRAVLIKSASDFEKTGKPSRAPPLRSEEEAAAEEEEQQQRAGAKKKGGRAQQQTPSPSLFVGNLGFEVTRADLRAIFRAFGALVGVRVATFEDNPEKCKGFAYIDFKYTDDATKALKSPEVRQIGGRRVRIEYAGDEATRKGRPWEFDPKTRHGYSTPRAGRRAADGGSGGGGGAAAAKARRLETETMAETKLQGLPVEFEGQKITFGD